MSLRAWELRDIAPFTTLPRSQRVVVAASVELYTYRHGEQVFHAGEHCTDATILLDGFVRLFRTNLDGAEVTTAIVSPGSMVTTAMLRGRAVYDAHAEAIGRIRTLQIPTPTFLDLMCRYPAFAEEVVSSLIVRTHERYMDITAESYGELWSRILSTLRRLARSTRTGGHEGAVLPLAYRLSHAEIARLVGANRSSVTRALRLLDERGLIRLEHGHVTGVRP